MAALAATLLPALTGLALLGLAPWLERRFGAAAASAVGARATLAAAVLAILLLWQSVQHGQLEHRFAWLHVGRTTAIDWLIGLDPLALLLAAVALLGMTLGVISGLAVGPGEGARPYARVALAGGGLLALAGAGTLWQAALALGAITLACRAWPREHDAKALPDRTWLLGLVGLGIGVAGLAWIGAAGDLELATLERSALLQERSELVRGRLGGPFGAASPGAIAAVGLGAAALAWALAWPRLLARAWGEGPASAAMVALAGPPAIGLIALRTHLPLALAPTALALLTALAAGLAAWAGIRAARARTAFEVVAAGAQVVPAIAVAAFGFGEPVAAARLLVVGGLAPAVAITALGADSRVGRAVSVGLAAIGVVAAGGAAVAALWANLSAWSSGLNAAAPALALVGLAGLAAGMRRVLADMTEAPAWPRPEAGSLLLGVAAVQALAAALVGLWPLGERLWPAFVSGRVLTGAYALGPRADVLSLGTGGGAALVGLALAAGLAMARRVPVGPAREAGAGWRAGAGGATAPRLLRLGDRLIARVALWPGDERVVTAPGPLDLRRPLLLATAGTLAILGSVFCNPDVVVLGPTRVHPVDLGGLDAAMVGARKAAPEEPATSLRPPAPRPEAEIDGVGPAPLGEIDAIAVEALPGEELPAGTGTAGASRGGEMTKGTGSKRATPLRQVPDDMAESAASDAPPGGPR